MTILEGFKGSPTACVRLVWIGALGAILSACGGGGDDRSSGGGGGGGGNPPPTSLSCEGYPKSVGVSVNGMQQTYTQVCLILQENAQITPSVSASTPVGNLTAHGTPMLDSYYAYARIVAQAADEGTATALAQSVVVTTANSTISASPDQVDSPQSLNIDFEIFTAPSTNLTLTTTDAGDLAVDNYDALLQLTSSKVGNATLKDLQGQVSVNVGTGSIDVTLSGTGWSGAGLNASTQLGGITLSRPTEYQAAFTAQTALGTASIDGTQASTVTAGQPAVVKAGSGAPITLESMNGNVSVVATQ